VSRASILMLLLLLAVLVLATAPFVGMEEVPLRTLFGGEDVAKHEILWRIRIPRVAMAFLAGSGLAVAGMAFQAMFRNPLATPFTLGTASGASLGAVLCIYAGWQFSVAGFSGVSLFAFAGALTSIGVVYGLSRVRQGFSTATMLLAGVALSFFFSSLILLLQYISDFTHTFRMLRWVMGGLENVVDFHDVLGVFPFAVAGCLIVL